MENIKKIQTSPKQISYSGKINNREKSKTNKEYNMSNKISSKKENKNINLKNNQENEMIKLQTETVIGKLYKKSNETEWAAQNRAMIEKKVSNYEIKQIIKRYNFNKSKLKYGFSNEYINLLTELLYSRKKDYSKERLKLSKYRIYLSTKHKQNKNFINNLLKSNENKKYNRQKTSISEISSPFKINNLYNINNNIYMNISNNIHRNSYQYSEKNDNKRINLLNNEINLSNKPSNNEINIIDNNNLILLNTVKSNNKIKNLELDKSAKNSRFILNTINNQKKSKDIYYKILNNPKSIKIINELNKMNLNKLNNNYFINSSSKTEDKNQFINNSSNIKKMNNIDNKKISQKIKFKSNYENERDIYFEKEKEEDEFLLSGDKDKYEDYLKNKFSFFEDLENKQTQYIYEIKKRNYALFNNKIIEMKDNYKNPLSFINKISRKKNEKNNIGKIGYNIHDLFKPNYTKNELNKIRLNLNSKKILKNLNIKI